MFPISHHGPEMKVMMSAISFGFEIIHSVAELKKIYLQFLHRGLGQRPRGCCVSGHGQYTSCYRCLGLVWPESELQRLTTWTL